MATTTDVPAGVQMIALEEIRTDRNVRQQLVAEEVDALAQSIKLLGQLTPVSVRPATDGSGDIYFKETVVSGGEGVYTAPSLAPGEYDLRVQANGFRTALVRATLQTAQTLDVPVILTLESAAESVQVRSEAPLLDTAETRIQATLTTQTLDSLPLQGRQFEMGVTSSVGRRRSLYLGSRRLQ